jgi:hypothetical protein
VQACRKLKTKVTSTNKGTLDSISRLLVLGTEECMYPAIMLGAYIEEYYPKVDVWTHSTTRSPIIPSDSLSYPIRNGSMLCSCYERNRNTYLYNIEKYDAVFVITDAEAFVQAGIDSLYAAMFACGNDRVSAFVWEV